jgi:hypothetical protein
LKTKINFQFSSFPPPSLYFEIFQILSFALVAGHSLKKHSGWTCWPRHSCVTEIRYRLFVSISWRSFTALRWANFLCPYFVNFWISLWYFFRIFFFFLPEKRKENKLVIDFSFIIWHDVLSLFPPESATFLFFCFCADYICLCVCMFSSFLCTVYDGVGRKK